jgi:hypothetical protein
MRPSTVEIIEIIRVYANITGDISLFKTFNLCQFGFLSIDNNLAERVLRMVVSRNVCCEP